MRAYEMASEKNPDADVYVCLTDTLAVPIIRGLEKDNKKAAVTGYANFEIAEVFDLTTIEQNIPMLGSKAFITSFSPFNIYSVIMNIQNTVRNIFQGNL